MGWVTFISFILNPVERAF